MGPTLGSDAHAAGCRHTPLSRRAVLVGGASMLLLAACGDDKTPATRARPRTEGTYSLVTFTDAANSVQAGSPQRVTFGLGDAQGALVDNGPRRLSFDVLADNKVIARVDSPLHHEGLTRGYYPVAFTPPKPGFYTAQTSVHGHRVDASFQAVQAHRDPATGQAVGRSRHADHR